MSKWSSITFNDSVVPEETSKGIQWTIAAWLLVAIAVTVFFATTRSRPAASVQRQSEVPVTMVVGAKAEPEISADPVEAVVSAKNAPVVSKLWATTEASSIEEPNLDTEGGLGFSDFQRAFSESREKRAFETSKKHFVSGDMKAYAESHDVPDAFLDAVGTERQSETERSVKKIDGPEAMMLAREALQTIQGTSDAAASIMRDILAARTEAARAGIELPEVPEEQKAQLQVWASRSGPASVLAKTILSR